MKIETAPPNQPASRHAEGGPPTGKTGGPITLAETTPGGPFTLADDIFFANVEDGTRLCLGLAFLIKKTQKAPPDAIALAEDRLRAWHRSRSG